MQRGSLEKHNLIPSVEETDIARVETVLTERNLTAAAGVKKDD
jgi:ribosomal protein L29